MTTYPQPSDPVATFTRADGTTEAHSTDHGRVIGIWENAKAHSAKGDGVTDDSTAIQAAITACTAAGGGVVYLPADTYAISTGLTVPAGVHLVGAGQFASVLSYSGTGWAITVGDAAASAYAYGCAVDGLRVLLTAAGGNGIRLMGTSGASLRNLIVDRSDAADSTGVGVQFAVSSGSVGTILSRLDNIYVSHIKTCFQTTGAAGQHTTIIGTLCTAISDIANAGVGLDLNASNGDGHVFVGFNFEANATAIKLTSTNGIKFIGTRFEDDNTTDISIDAISTGNVFIAGNGFDAAKISVANGVGYSDNQFIACATSTGPLQNRLVGNALFDAFAVADVPLTTRAATAGQTGNLFEAKSSSGQILFALKAAGGIATYNAVAATQVLGAVAVVKKLEIFDATGASIGFLPIYATIT